MTLYWGISSSSWILNEIQSGMSRAKCTMFAVGNDYHIVHVANVE